MRLRSETWNERELEKVEMEQLPWSPYSRESEFLDLPNSPEKVPLRKQGHDSNGEDVGVNTQMSSFTLNRRWLTTSSFLSCN